MINWQGKDILLKLKKALQQPTPKKRRAFIHICALFTTVCRQLKQSLLQREQRYLGP